MTFFRVKVREQIETNVTVIADTQAAAEADALLFRKNSSTIVKTVETQPLTNTVIGTTNIITDDDGSLTKKYAKAILEIAGESFADVKLTNVTSQELTDLQAAIANLTTVVNTIKS